MPPFEPSDGDRNAVMAMSAMGIPEERIRQVVKNPRTGKAIEIETLHRALGAELAAGRANVDLMWSASMVSGIKAGDNFKMSMWARNRLGWDKPGLKLDLGGPAQPGETAEQDGEIRIVLVRSPKRDEDGNPV